LRAQAPIETWAKNCPLAVRIRVPAYVAPTAHLKGSTEPVQGGDPKPGHRSPSWLKRERQRAFREARAWRAGGEARIARLKNTFGMRRARYKGESGVARR
jgi:hypothetical protein